MAEVAPLEGVCEVLDEEDGEAEGGEGRQVHQDGGGGGHGQGQEPTNSCTTLQVEIQTVSSPSSPSSPLAGRRLADRQSAGQLGRTGRGTDDSQGELSQEW